MPLYKAAFFLGFVVLFIVFSLSKYMVHKFVNRYWTHI